MTIYEGKVSEVYSIGISQKVSKPPPKSPMKSRLKKLTVNWSLAHKGNVNMLTCHFFNKLLTEQSVAIVAVSDNSHCLLQKVLQHSDSSCNMTMRNSIKTCKSDDPKEGLLIELDARIKETQLTVGTLNQVKQTIMDNSNIISHTFVA